MHQVYYIHYTIFETDNMLFLSFYLTIKCIFVIKWFCRVRKGEKQVNSSRANGHLTVSVVTMAIKIIESLTAKKKLKMILMFIISFVICMFAVYSELCYQPISILLRSKTETNSITISVHQLNCEYFK